VSLSILIWLPLVISLIAGQLPGRLIGRATALGSLITLGVAISFLARFDTGASGLQFVTDKVWIGALGIHYSSGSTAHIALIVLTTVLFSGSLIWSAGREWDRPRLFYLHFGLAQTAVLGAFCAQDLALFVAFFDLMLIPFYFLTGMWGTGPDPRPRHHQARDLHACRLVPDAGGGDRDRRACLLGSRHAAHVRAVSLQHLPLSKTSQEWIFLCFAVASRSRGADPPR